MDYLLVYTKFRKIMTAFEECNEKQMNELVQEFEEKGTFKNERAASLIVYQLKKIVEPPGR